MSRVISVRYRQVTRRAVCRPLSRRFTILALLGIFLTVLPNTGSAQIGDRDQYWHQGSPGVQDTNEDGDEFGLAVAAGDFDCDGWDDLAIGAPSEDVLGVADAGVVHVIYGSSNGLAIVLVAQYWTQANGALEGIHEEDDRFGSDLTAGDFDNDGCDDLAIGVVGEDIGDVSEAGAVQVLYGTPTGLLATDNQIWHQASAGIPDDAEAFDSFGIALASGDFDDDGFDDLAIGVLEGFGDELSAGAVHVLYGGSTGLSASGNQLWHQDSPGIAGMAEFADYFGARLAAGNFDGDDYDDLAIGVHFEDLGSTSNTGAVNVLYGGSSGLSGSGSDIFDQDNLRDPGDAEAEDQFGAALAAGDFDDDGYSDLAVAARYEDIESLSRTNAGQVWVVYGGPFGLFSSFRLTIWDQGLLAGTLESGDAFGTSLTSGDFDGDGIDDLVVGIPAEDLGSTVNTGAVQVIYGSGSGLTPTGNQLIDQDSPGIQGSAEEGDNFGFSLATGDFDNDGADDLAVGVAWEDLFGFTNAGVVQAIYGSALIFADGFESGDISAWSSAVP